MNEEALSPSSWSVAGACPEEAHPKIAELHRYWRRIHPIGGLPGRQHIDPADIPRLLPGIWMLNVHVNPLRFRYRLAGTEIIRAMGREVTGLWLDDVFDHWGPDIPPYRRYAAVVEQAVPSWRKGLPYNADVTRCPILENIIFPLASDAKNVDVLLALTVYYWL